MSVRYSIEHELRLIRVTLTGELSDESLVEADTVFREDEDANPDYDQLMDCSHAVGQSITREALIDLTSRPPYFSNRCRRAIVVSTKAAFGMARMFELLREDKAGEFRVFYDVHQAETWLKR